MTPKTIDQNPVVSDQILFEFATPDANGCLLANPYKVDKLVVYFVERSFTDNTTEQYTNEIYDLEKLEAYKIAEKNVCNDPTESNIRKAKEAKLDLESSKNSQIFYYKEAVPVFILGTEKFPAWLSTDQNNSLIKLEPLDPQGNNQYAHFSYVWDTTSYREGDYFLCVTWTPLIAGDQLSSHIKFTLGGNTSINTVIPSHFTKPEKYSTLLEKYTPELFKMRMSSDDVTPDVLNTLNLSVADGFTVLEDYANQIIDLFDANVLTENFLPYLSNLFNLKLKSNDPFLWRRQIKRAIPLFKKNGTQSGLIESLDQVGIKFIKYTRLWQVISNHTWQELFNYDGSSYTWLLEKTALALDLSNFELYYRAVDSDTWLTLSSDYIQFGEEDGISTITWIGDSLSISPISLSIGDSIRVIYKFKEIMSMNEQYIENYIRTLSLSDQRDERNQEYPLKNWNVRLIEENDPLFEIVIPTRNPFHDPVVFGRIRTEFPYSENVYNMEEYNGSIRSSTNPCDIDKGFIDPCFSSLSSKYNIDLEIEGLGDDRIIEAYDVLRESLPFHAVLNVMNVYGGFTEIVESPEENMEILVNVQGYDFVISGQAQAYFNRAMKRGLTTSKILRDELASSTSVYSGSGTAYNDSIMLFAGDVFFNNLPIPNDGSAILKILTGALIGEYYVNNPSKNTIEVTGMTEPISETNTYFSTRLAINQKVFSFNLSSLIPESVGNCNVYQDNIFKFYDADQSFQNFKSLWDVDQGYSNGTWKINIPAYSLTSYNIINVLSDGSIKLEDNGTLPSSNLTGITYSSYDKDNNLLFTSSTGVLTVESQGRTKVLTTTLQDIRNVFPVGCYQKVSGVEYKISGYVENTLDEFYVENYSGGDSVGISLDVYFRIVNNGMGYLSHKGLKLQASTNLESSLGIANGANNLVAVPLEDNHFKENYLVEIDSNLYFINEINNNLITLSGVDTYWETLSAGGTSVSFTIYRYLKTEDVTIPKQQYELPPATFNIIDRRGSEVTYKTEEDVMPMAALSDKKPDNFVENLNQKESIEFTVEYSDGNQQKGKI